MKLVRYGEPGRERPGLIDANGAIRDLTGLVQDLSGDSLSPATLARIRAADPAGLPLVEGAQRLGPCVGRPGNFIAIGLNYADHAAEAGMQVPSGAHPLHQGAQLLRRRGRRHHHPQGLDETRLGTRTRLRHRRARVLCERGERARSCRGLFHLQRRVGARVADRAPRAMGEGQERADVRPHRPMAGHARRTGRRAEPRHVARRERPAPADRQHAHDGVRRAPARVLRVAIHDARPRRHHHHRHAARRRRSAASRRTT